MLIAVDHGNHTIKAVHRNSISSLARHSARPWRMKFWSTRGCPPGALQRSEGQVQCLLQAQRIYPVLSQRQACDHSDSGCLCVPAGICRHRTSEKPSNLTACSLRPDGGVPFDLTITLNWRC